MMDESNIRIDILPLKAVNIKPHHPPGFVRIQHIPSGITVTKYYQTAQIHAKFCAETELEELVKLWEAHHG